MSDEIRPRRPGAQLLLPQRLELEKSKSEVEACAIKHLKILVSALEAHGFASWEDKAKICMSLGMLGGLAVGPSSRGLEPFPELKATLIEIDDRILPDPPSPAKKSRKKSVEKP